MYNNKEACESIKNLCQRLGISEYTEGLSDKEITDLAFFHFRGYLKENWESLYENIHEGDENDD